MRRGGGNSLFLGWVIRPQGITSCIGCGAATGRFRCCGGRIAAIAGRTSRNGWRSEVLGGIGGRNCLVIVRGLSWQLSFCRIFLAAAPTHARDTPTAHLTATGRNQDQDSYKIQH